MRGKREKRDKRHKKGDEEERMNGRDQERGERMKDWEEANISFRERKKDPPHLIG